MRSVPEGEPSPDKVGSVQELFTLFYEELRAVARRHVRRERRGNSLHTTSLVHEAYLRMRGHRVPFHDRTHFLAFASTSMRRVLVEHARARLAVKRGAKPRRLAFDERLDVRSDRLLDVLAVDEALESLTRKSPRKARVAELRLFAGLSVEETSGIVGASVRTVKDDWRFARAWLSRRLKA